MRISDWSSDVCSSDLAVHPYAGVTMEWLNDIYLQQVGFPAEPGPDNDLLREALQKHIADLKPAAVSAFFNGKPYVAAEIADLASHRPLFRQPAVLLAYYLVVRIQIGRAHV